MPLEAEDANRPVRLLGRKLACQNTKFNVYLDHIAGAGGEEVRDYLVVEPLDTPGGGAVAPLAVIAGICVLPVAGKSVGLIRVFRHAIGDWAWEVPRGFVDSGEEPMQAALRELAEETGLVATSENTVPLGYVTPEAGLIRGRAALFAARDAVAGGRVEQEIGLGQLQWFTLDDAVAMAMEAEIQCAVSALAVLRYAVRSGPLRA